MTAKSKLTLGPVLFSWAAETWRDFYFRIADEAEVDEMWSFVKRKKEPRWLWHAIGAP